jgi:SAM-dependent methyltransferase
MNCRHCQSPLNLTFLDLGHAPPSNAYLTRSEISAPELYFPLRLFACEECWLVQTEDYARADQLFCADYAYFSSVSRSWLEHAARYVEMISAKLGLGPESFVIEIASNDGYLLKNFVAAGVPCLGIEPTASTAAAAEALGIPVLREFFGTGLAGRLAGEGRQADLILGNNVFAHVPDINDFTAALKRALKPEGTITLEFPHLMRLIEKTQFDTVYHEHFSYLSLYTVARIFERAGLTLFDVEELATHGGSLRVYGCHAEEGMGRSAAVIRLLEEEGRRGMRSPEPYRDFQSRADRVKNDLVGFLLEQKRQGRKVVAYGAAAKGNTLLNYAGVRPDLLPYVCDAAPSKQGKFLPGSHIPILPPGQLLEDAPDYVLILPWNIADEVISEHSSVLARGSCFVAAVPELHFIEPVR